MGADLLPAAVSRWVAQGGVLILAGGWRAYRAASLTDGQSAAHFEACPRPSPRTGRAVPVGQGSIVYLSDADRFTNAQAGQGRTPRRWCGSCGPTAPRP